MSSRSNKDGRLADSLTNLHRHMKSCDRCAAARKGKTPRDLCDNGAMMVLYAADLYGDVIRQRIKARERTDHMVFACPDLTAHGQGYSMTATPLIVTAIQGTVF